MIGLLSFYFLAAVYWYSAAAVFLLFAVEG